MIGRPSARVLCSPAPSALSFWLLNRDGAPGSLLSPPLIALLLVAILIPAIVLMVLLSRRVRDGSGGEGGAGSGRLHTRLVALFSVIAAVPTVMVAIFASLLLQSGLEFWFSDRARGMLENTVELARRAYHQRGQPGRRRGCDDGGRPRGLSAAGPDRKPAVSTKDLAFQAYQRTLNEAAIINVDATARFRSLGGVNGYDGLITTRSSASTQTLRQARGRDQRRRGAHQTGSL